MGAIALVAVVAWLVLVSGLPALTVGRRTGAVRLPPPVSVGSAQWWARIAGSIGILLAFAAPIADLLGMAPIDLLDEPFVRIGGVGVFGVGLIGTLVSQAAMGDAWMPDVDPSTSTELVTRGPFAVVRNPVLACTEATVIGLALMVPNVLAALMVGAVVVSHQVQVRLVEEPFLRRTHGDAYRRYAARTGRFVPWVGRTTWTDEPADRDRGG